MRSDARGAIACQLCAIRLLCDHKVRLSAPRCRENLDKADAILALPGVRVESENQRLPKVPSGVGYCVRMQKDMIADGFVRCEPKGE